MMLVTLEDVRSHCRVTYTAEDDDLVGKIAGASEAVVSYLDGAATFIDSTGDANLDLVPYVVKQATLRVVEWMFSQRGANGLKDGNGNYLPEDVVALLYPLRVPVLG